ADRQSIWLIISTVAMLIAAIHPRILRWLRQYRYLILIIGLGLLISTIIAGRNPSGFGPALWLGIGQVFFQPSEILKIILVAFLASYLSEQYPALRTDIKSKDNSPYWRSPRIMGPIMLMWSICIVVLVWQRDLGTAILFFAVFIILLYVSSGQPLIILSGIILTGLAAIAAYTLFDVVQLRIDIWLNPWAEADGRAYQIVQSLMAFSAGGVTGNGIGLGSPGYIPVVHSDFVFAALAEEWGFIGVIVLISALLIFVMRGLQTALLSQERPYRTLLATGLSMLIAVQSLLIMGGVLKLVPLTGVTLPWVSYGGSSLLMSFILTGLLLRLSAEVSHDAG
ncbi:MAG: FtsW/RodA/SpoVE family cell cycle protein, partial [Aggregatilineales bacterium]